MSDCKCEFIKLYDGEHRCMLCFKEFTEAKAPGENWHIEYETMQEVINSPSYEPSFKERP